MDFNMIGCIAEYKFAVMAMEQGINVSFPLLDASKYDCITDSKNGLKKIQIKSASSDEDTVRCYLQDTNKKCYSLKSVDYFAVWIKSHKGFYIIKNNGKFHSLVIHKGGKYSKNFNNFAVL
jgi:hypothetical protein